MSALQLRHWQARAVARISSHPDPDFLLVAAPAAGKTRAAIAAAGVLLERHQADQLILVCPTVLVRDQWARALTEVGYRMQTTLDAQGWPAHQHGVAVTYAQVAARPQTFADACRNRATVTILDEIHHGADNRVWGGALRHALTDARARLLLSGTPFRSDGDQIPFVRYAPDGHCIPDFTYSYPEAIRDEVCRPVRFVAHDATVTYRTSENLVRTGQLNDPHTTHADRTLRLRAGLDPAQIFLRQMLARAHQDLVRIRRRIPDAAGLIVCDTQEHAREVDQLLTTITQTVPALATSDVPRAHQAISSFNAEADSQWLVSVRMVSEGVDIPRLCVTVLASAAKSEVLMRQIVGRSLRRRPQDPDQEAIVHLAADPDHLAYARRLHVVKSLRASAPQPPAKLASSTGTPSRPRRRPTALALRAVASDQPTHLTPISPTPRSASAPQHAQSAVSPTIPALPPSPEELQRAAARQQADRAQLMDLLTTYVLLRRETDPQFTILSARRELAEHLQTATIDQDPETISTALCWVRRRTGELAGDHPALVRRLATLRRAQRLAS